MELAELQQRMKEFNEARGWEKDTHHIKDFLLNMCEEVGEAWNVIKWVDGNVQKQLIEKHKDEFENFIGDQLFLVLKVAYLLDINPEKELIKVFEEYEKRFPAEEVKAQKHGNPLAGGIDYKDRVE